MTGRYALSMIVIFVINPGKTTFWGRYRIHNVQRACVMSIQWRFAPRRSTLWHRGPKNVIVKTGIPVFGKTFEIVENK